ncbi:MAG: type II toxin-antitoxin system MqsR family toxin [Mariprofundaceae bacterium]
MEKRKPTYDLASIKAAVAEGRYRLTLSPRQSAYGMGMSDADVVHTVEELKRSDFYKSMTTFRNSRVWQDVYRPRRSNRVLYVKFQIDDVGYLIVSFKEK